MACNNNVLEIVKNGDFIEYFLFPQIDTNDFKKQEIILQKFLKEIEKILEIYTTDYIWHKDKFKLILKTSLTNTLAFNEEKTEYLPPHLYGITHFGDNIEDEWFIVFLLQKFTEEIDDLIVRVHDADGEFLLIESSNYLPSWANPETCENRVYIYKGNIHLISPDNIENSNINYEISVNEALKLIRDNSDNSIADYNIQKAINSKLNNYPDKISENFHHTVVYLPIGVAAILKERQDLIAPAINAFYQRDSIDLKVCNAMKYFPPENCVYTYIKFTKCLFAMLSHIKYIPDRRIGWNLPSTNDTKYDAHILGVKIACGFEILINQGKPSDNIEQDKGWHHYLNNLKKKNYFNDLLEHSRDYNNLLNKAKEYYINHCDTMRYMPVIGQEILQLTKTLEYDIDEFKNNEKNLPLSDDNSWLKITPNDLDKMLQDNYGQQSFEKITKNSDPKSFTKKVNTFLEQISDVDGIEYLSESTKSVNNQINFDPNLFNCAIKNILNMDIPEDNSWGNESDSDMSDYADDNSNIHEKYNNLDDKMQKYMNSLDEELAETTIADSFEKKSINNTDGFDDIENFQPVDIDMNALKNILQSYQSQFGESGPSSNMLGPMGIHFDVKSTDSE